MYHNLTYEVKNRIAIITLNRPEVRNAINAQMLTELGEVISRGARDVKVNVIVLTGTGKDFCAGHDIMENRQEPRKNTEAWINEAYKPPLMGIVEMGKPVISAVNGAAAGIGSAFAMICDLTIMAEDAFILLPFVTIATIPDGGATWLLTHVIGYKRAYQLAVEAERIPAQRCLELGLANRVVPGDKLMGEALSWAERLAERAPLSLALTKKAMHRAKTLSLSEAISYEAKLQSICTSSEDFAEGVEAFFRKRKPHFKGR